MDPTTFAKLVVLSCKRLCLLFRFPTALRCAYSVRVR